MLWNDYSAAFIIQSPLYAARHARHRITLIPERNGARVLSLVVLDDELAGFVVRVNGKRSSRVAAKKIKPVLALRPDSKYGIA